MANNIRVNNEKNKGNKIKAKEMLKQKQEKKIKGKKVLKKNLIYSNKKEKNLQKKAKRKINYKGKKIFKDK